LVEKLVGLSVFTVLFGPNSSHFAQPLDGVVFAIAKQEFRAQLQEIVLLLSGNSDSSLSAVMMATYAALEKSLKPYIIKKSFEERFIWPFKKDALLELGRKWSAQKLGSVDAVHVEETLQKVERIRNEKIQKLKEKHPVVSSPMKPKTPKSWISILDSHKKAEQEKEYKAIEAEKKKEGRKEEND